MDWLDWPEEAREKSVAIPETGNCLEVRDGLEMVIVPDCCPAVVGANASCRAQWLAVSRFAPQSDEAT